MRICQNCGHKDLPWKNRLYRLFTDYCHIEELDVWDEALAKKIRGSPKFFSDGIFNYRLKPDGFVFRIWKQDARTPFSLQEPPKEKHRKKIAGNQKKLAEIFEA